MSHLSRSSLLAALLLLGGCGSHTVTPTPSSTEGGNIGGGAGGTTHSSASGSSGTGSVGTTGGTGATGATGSTATSACAPSAAGGPPRRVTVRWSFPLDQSCSALSGDVTHIEIQVAGSATIPTVCGGDASQPQPQSSYVATLAPGTWAASVRGEDSAGKVNYAGVTQFTVKDVDVTVPVTLTMNDVPAANKICGLPR